uniref:Uncharacterized protein n=1 Tax=Arundo donax TaxID=35708 RepID=A0A0A9B0C5_ARUDO
MQETSSRLTDIVEEFRQQPPTNQAVSLNLVCRAMVHGMEVLAALHFNTD